ncbi:MAG: hypothetical protein Fues2KO_19070 [Fuerstiella sp.]
MPQGSPQRHLILMQIEPENCAAIILSDWAEVAAAVQIRENQAGARMWNVTRALRGEPQAL